MLQHDFKKNKREISVSVSVSVSVGVRVNKNCKNRQFLRKNASKILFFRLFVEKNSVFVRI